ncbi:MAG: sigma-70 family RNA polymerase sigma factor [Verrucomicrobiales bacterium]|nr:sigma-70 family RNA polymerase sigma factor [Verrucomicrobiales bacterium]
MREPDNAKINISLRELRDGHSSRWTEAFERLWKVGWLSARRKLPFDSDMELEDLVSRVLGKEIVPQLVSPEQESFRRAQTFDDILNLTSRIISNRAIDEIRKRARRPGLSNLEAVPEKETAVVADEVSSGRCEEVQLAVGSLEERYRDVIEDFYFEELSTEEIARKRGRPKGSVCSDLVKARQILGASLGERLNHTTL